MERRFFGFLVHLVATFTVVTAGRILKSYNPSRAVKAREEYGNGPIRLELKATNTDNKDLAILLETILDVKDFVKLVHVIAINHLDGIDLRDVHDKSQEQKNLHGTQSLLENEEDVSNSEERIFANDNTLLEYEIRQELLAVSSNLRRQPETLDALSRHFNNVVRKVLTEILADLKNQSKNKQKFVTPTIRRRITRIEEITKVMKETIALLRTRPRKEKEIGNETPDLWDVDFSRQFTNFDLDPLSTLYEESKILQRLVLENPCRRHQDEASEQEEPIDLNEAFDFFMKSSEHFKITEKLQKFLKVVLRRIIKIHDMKTDNQLSDDYQKQKGIKNNETSINLQDDNENVATKQPRSNTKKQYTGDKITQSRGGINTNDQNTTNHNEQVTVSHSKNNASLKNVDANMNVPELQITTDGVFLENLHEVLTTRKAIQDFKEEQKNYSAPTIEQKATTSYPKTSKKIPEKSNDTDATNLIIDKPETGTHNKINEIDHAKNVSIHGIVNPKNDTKTKNNKTIVPAIETIRNEDNEGKIEDKKTTNLSVDPIVTERNENGMTDNTTDPSIDVINNEENEKETGTKIISDPSVDTNVTEGYKNNTVNNTTDPLIKTFINEENKRKTRNENISNPSVVPIETVVNEENKRKTGNKSISNPSVVPIETVVNDENKRKTGNKSISNPSVVPIENVVNEENKRKTGNKSISNPSVVPIKTVVNEENKRKTGNKSISNPSVVPIKTLINDENKRKIGNKSISNPSVVPIETVVNEENKRKTGNKSISNPSIVPIETVVNEENKRKTGNKSISNPSIVPIETLINEENKRKTGNKSISNPSVVPIEIVVNDENKRKTGNKSISNPSVRPIATVVNDENKRKTGNKTISNPSVVPIEIGVNKNNENKTRNKSISDPPVDPIKTIINEKNQKKIISDPSVEPNITQRYENNTSNNIIDPSIETFVNEDNEKKTGNKSISDASVVPIETVINIENKNKTGNKSISDASVVPIETVINIENKNKTRNKSTLDTSDVPIETVINEENEKKTMNESISNPSVDPTVTEGYENITTNTITDPSIENNKTIHLAINPNEIEQNEGNIHSSLLNDTIVNEAAEENTKSNNTEDQLTAQNPEKPENNPTDLYSSETTIPEEDTMHTDNPTIDGKQKDEEYTENESQETIGLDPDELSSEYNKDEFDSSMNSMNTNINIVTFPLSSRKNKTVAENAIEEPDGETTMRFGSDDWYNTKKHKKNSTKASGSKETKIPDQKTKTINPSLSSNHSKVEASSEKEITLPPKKNDHSLAAKPAESPEEIIYNGTSLKSNANDSQLAQSGEKDFVTSNGTRKSLGPSDISVSNDTDKEMKKYIMSLILEALNSLMANNSTVRIEPKNQGKTLRSC